jgi:predicted nuclease with TOPRIM domain
MKMDRYIAWTLAGILLCCTSVLSYREWERSYSDTPHPSVTELREEHYELQEQVMQLSANIAEVKQLATEGRDQALTNLVNMAMFKAHVDYLDNKFDELIEKLSIALPGGAFISPPKPAELKELNPRIIAPETYNELQPEPEEAPLPPLLEIPEETP